MTIASAKKDIDIIGSNIEGENIKLDAKENLNISASKNTNKTDFESKSSSASIGATISSVGTSYNVSGSMSKGEVSANGTTYNESNVTAKKDLDFTSGNDTNIKGGMLSGEKVTGNIGNDLNIESKQDSNSYKESSKSVGASVGIGSGSVSGSVNSSKIDSNYNSVTDQSGIYAGEGGFDIGVGKNTDLKGGLISSEADADKNKISTGTLKFEDIKNDADYKAGSVGVNANINNGADYNEKGVTPAIGMPASGEAESTTKATISEGTIEIRDKENQKQDVDKLNRDTTNSLNKLGEIFDKTKVEERQELANLFGELAYNEIHYMDGSDEQKALYHAVVGGIMSKLANGEFLAGASAAGINKLVIEEIKKIADYDPDKIQWISAALGAVIGELVASNAQAGASAAASGTKNNDYYEESLAQRGIDPTTVTIKDIDNINGVLSDDSLSFTGSVMLAITGEGVMNLIENLNEKMVIDNKLPAEMNQEVIVNIDGHNKALLKNVTKIADKTVDVFGKSYDVYINTTKYNEIALVSAIAIDFTTVYMVTKASNRIGKQRNLPVLAVKTIDGTTVYFVDKEFGTPMKNYIQKNNDDWVNNRKDNMMNGGID